MSIVYVSRGFSAAVGRRFGCVAVLALLSGCGCTGDPRTDNAGCATVGVLGGYSQQTSVMRAEANDAQMRATSLRAENERLNAQIGRLRSEERFMVGRLQSLNSALAGQITRLDQARTERRASESQLASLNQQARALEQRQIRLSQAARDGSRTSRQEIESLEAENARLRRSIDALVGGSG